MNLYFNEIYGKLYESHDKAIVKTFNFENEHGKITNMFLLKEIPYKIDKEVYYDISTPYGFGGPIISYSSDQTQLLKDYQESFSMYCKNENIVTEFVRFHPLENQNVRAMFDGEVEHIGLQVIRNLTDPIETNISKRILKCYRRNARNGLRTVIDETGEYIDEFLSLYYSTMNRHNASDYYYFEQSFFDNLHKELKGNFMYTHIFLDGEMISSGLILYDNQYGYGFLGATKESFYDISPNVSCEIDGIKWLKDKGVKYYLMGGGQDGDDGIYQFKKRFAKNSDYHYFVGKKIHNHMVYDKLVANRFSETGEQKAISFFPPYRATQNS